LTLFDRDTRQNYQYPYIFVASCGIRARTRRKGSEQIEAVP